MYTIGRRLPIKKVDRGYTKVSWNKNARLVYLYEFNRETFRSTDVRDFLPTTEINTSDETLSYFGLYSSMIGNDFNEKGSIHDFMELL